MFLAFYLKERCSLSRLWPFGPPLQDNKQLDDLEKKLVDELKVFEVPETTGGVAWYQCHVSWLEISIKYIQMIGFSSIHPKAGKCHLETVFCGRFSRRSFLRIFQLFGGVWMSRVFPLVVVNTWIMVYHGWCRVKLKGYMRHTWYMHDVYVCTVFSVV